MSLTAIAVRFPDESVELENVEERRVLTALEVIYEDGSLHGKTADFPTRDLERVVVGLHLRNWHFFELMSKVIKERSARNSESEVNSDRSVSLGRQGRLDYVNFGTLCSPHLSRCQEFFFPDRL